MMLNQVHLQIVSKLTETLLLARNQPNKQFLTHITKVFSALQQPHHQLPSNLTQLLPILVPHNTHKVKQKMIGKLPKASQNQETYIGVVFSLYEKESGVRRQVQVWQISATRIKIGEIDLSTELVTLFFKQIVVLLNKLPLMSVYQREEHMKKSYLLHYKFFSQIHNNNLFSLASLQGKTLIDRKNAALSLKARVSYAPCLNFLFAKSIPTPPELSPRKTSINTSQYSSQDKISVYAFYDKELDFTFLSSGEQQSEIISEEIKLQVSHEEISTEFQLLICEDDQAFVENNRELFEILSKSQPTLNHK